MKVHIFSRRAPADAEQAHAGAAAEGTAAEPSRPAPAGVRYPHLYGHCPLTILSDGGGLLGHGRLLSYSTASLSIGRLPGELSLPLLGEGLRVRVCGWSADGDPFALGATVTGSTRQSLAVGSLEPMDGDGRRASPRYLVDREAELLPVDARSRAKPAGCRLRDVSLTGACVRTEAPCRVGDTVRLRLELYDKAGTISFVSEVVRADECDDGPRYGLLFAELTHDQRRYLEEDLRELRRREARRAI